ncbi:Lrp/AsnC family transcriptional regulator [Candidatus Bathyarchaeota archaeon]|nr:Lrp/AsnC family transcriptional regulator [Candidatus Bathyarchaeota archaeon]
MVTQTEEIDEIDAKILRDLLIDGRKGFTLIAKEAGVSKAIVWQHYKKLQRKKVIVGATVHLHYASLGYDTVANFFVNFESGKEEQVIKSVKRIPRIFSAGSMNNNADIWIVATMENNEEMEQIIQKIKELPFVLSLTTIVWMKLRSIMENLSVLSNNKSLTPGIATEKQVVNNIGKAAYNLDETDKQIIDKLALNGRESFRKIAKELKISTDTVTRRYRNLKQNSIIKTSIQLNPEKLGYTAIAYIDLSFVHQPNGPNIVDTLSKIPDVIKIIKTSGNFDLRLFTLMRSLENLFVLQNRITDITGVAKIKTTLQRISPIWPVPRENVSTF